MHQLLLLTGLTGTGKTAVLRELQLRGEQVLDLELLARHRGSAFGSLNQAPQPTQAEFELQLRALLAAFQPTRPIYLEQKGATLGHLRLPRWLPPPSAAIELTAPLPLRVARVLATYAHATNQQFAEVLLKLAARLPGETLEQAREALLRADRSAFIQALLPYYDAGSRYAPSPGGSAAVSTVCLAEAVGHVLALSKKLLI